MAIVGSDTQENTGTVAEQKASAISVKNVLFATDFAATSDAALPYATAICRRFGATLHAAHVLSEANLLLMTGGVDYISMGTIYEDAHAEAEEKLAHLAARVEVPVHCYVRHGQVWKGLAAIIQENEIDLIVVGTHGRTGLGKLVLGSVAEDILRHAPCPVLTVGPKVSGRAKLPAFESKGHHIAPIELDLQQILFATNFASDAPRMAQTAVGLAEAFRSQLTLMHVLEDYTELSQRLGAIEEGIRRLRNLIPKDVALPYAPETLLEFGSASECILRFAEEREADLIVLGARTSAEVGTTHLPWSTAHHVIAHAPCPVLTLRA
jgi:nucleotide-binding universal stress UspA family protein